MLLALTHCLTLWKHLLSTSQLLHLDHVMSLQKVVSQMLRKTGPLFLFLQDNDVVSSVSDTDFLIFCSREKLCDCSSHPLRPLPPLSDTTETTASKILRLEVTIESFGQVLLLFASSGYVGPTTNVCIYQGAVRFHHEPFTTGLSSMTSFDRHRTLSDCFAFCQVCSFFRESIELATRAELPPSATRSHTRMHGFQGITR